jgi:carboxymethylenebutenolidase
MNVQDSILDLDTPTGPMRTYVYAPVLQNGRNDKVPGLVLYSEIFQQTEPIRRLAVQFAGQGFVVMVPEIFHEHEPLGTVLGYDNVGKDKGNAYKCQTQLGTFDDDAKVVIRALQQHPRCNGRLGAFGVCIGGHLSFRAAFNPEILAAACFYPTDIHSGTLGAGKNSDSLARVRDIRGELLMVFGRQDPHVPWEGRVKIHETLEQSGVYFSWHEFNAAHAFMRDEGERYDPALARQCFGLACELFQRVL